MRSRFMYITVIILLSATAVCFLLAPGLLPPPRIHLGGGEPAKDSMIQELTAAPERKNKIDPGLLARSFHLVAIPKPPAANEIKDEKVQTTKPPVSADWIKPLGLISDESGTIRLYFKDTKNGKLMRIRQDGIEESGQKLLETSSDQYLISIDGEKYHVKRTKK